jgi:hypothetical protein
MSSKEKQINARWNYAKEGHSSIINDGTATALDLAGGRSGQL